MSDRPLLRVVRGNPDDVELAALTAVVAAAAAASAATAPAPARRASWWSDRATALRAPLHPGDGAWRASALPR
ncbi:acyl-CoA carboxylase epsilon subunit [Amycolatopsis sp. FDAARGOS 1241]|uniref:acyl-CoA carboxylase epsilon subunit n=1 Tax=Amycolatopsis sp. FDAARGOS 1241 TaxID=2778070 RepID=UPI00194EB310|nr:acyl-CoA carboxylase epsilon subunit [Amycolatopsis sp. FDAARGOS 1241]QRP45163.1 acyl-CoA carboxylase subunit epsilon [Amycolatopsis sp. FDAARGOS 1241]